MSGVVDAIFGGGQSAPDPNPGMQAAAQSSVDVAKIQQQTAKDYLDFSKQQYEEMKPLAEKVSGEMIAASEQDRAIAKSQEDRANDYYNYEKDTFRPLQEKAVQDAKDFNTDAKSEELARRSVADTEQAYSAQRQQALDTLASYGINPNSGRFASINARLAQSEAADKAGAATNARTNAEAMKYGRLTDAINMGNGLAGNATAAAGTAINANSGAVGAGATGYGIASNPGSSYGSSFGTASNIYGNANSAYGTAANTYGNIYSGQMQAYAANQQSKGAMMGRLATLAHAGRSAVAESPHSHLLTAARFTTELAQFAAPVGLLMTKFQQCYRMANMFCQQTRFKQSAKTNWINLSRRLTPLRLCNVVKHCKEGAHNGKRRINRFLDWSGQGLRPSARGKPSTRQR